MSKNLDVLNKKIEGFQTVISQVDPMDFKFPHMALTDYELLVSTIYKLNELIDVTNKYYNLVIEFNEWVINEGLSAAVLERLNEWLIDGTLGDLVNDVLFNTKLDKSEFEAFEIAQDLINNNKSPIWFNVKDYGAKGDGVTDDTLSIQYVHSLMSNFKGSTMYFPAGNYLVSVEEHSLMKGNSVILPKSFENFIFDKNAVMIMTPNDYYSYNMFLIEDANNILISGGTLRGEKDKHFGTTGQFGKGVFIFKNAHDVVIKNMIIENFWGDGIEIGFYVSENEQVLNGFVKSKDIYNIVIDSCELRFNRRQGISVIYTYGLIVRNCYIHNTGGTRPEAGIDLEPNFVTTIIDNILIENNVFENNNGKDIESMGGQKDNLVIRNNVFNKEIAVFSTHNLDFNNNVLNNCLIYMSRTVELTNKLSFKNNVFNNSHFESLLQHPYVLNVGHIYIEDNYFNMIGEKNRVLILTEGFNNYIYKTLDFNNNVIDVNTTERQDLAVLSIAQTVRHINVSNNIYNLIATTKPTMLSFIYPNSYSLNFENNKMTVSSGVMVNEFSETSMVSAGVKTKVINMVGNILVFNTFTPMANYLIIVRHTSLLKLLNNNTNRGIAKINDITELNTRDYALMSGNVGKTYIVNNSIENYALIDNNYLLSRLE